MNFQHTRNNPGKSEQMQGTAVKFDIKTGEFGDYALGKMTDNLGETVQMFYASSDDSPLPDIGCMNKLCIWGVKYDANTQRYKAYFNGFVGAVQQGQVEPYQPPQRPQTPPQQSNSPQATQSPGKDVRAKALEIAAILVAAGKHELIELYGLADFLVDYIAEGKHPAGVAGANPPEDDRWMDR